jgi:putative ABC transport system permease protein
LRLFTNLWFADGHHKLASDPAHREHLCNEIDIGSDTIGGTMEALLRSLRYSLRVLRRSSSLTLICVLSLAVGIGTNISIFSITDRLLLRNLPVEAPQELVAFSTNLSYPAYLEYRNANQVFSGLLAFATVRLNFGDSGHDQEIRGAFVSENYFKVLGIEMARGRGLLSEEENLQIAIITYQMWQQQFNSDPDVIGRIILLNGVRYTITGVARKGFNGTFIDGPMQIWLPLKSRPLLSTSSSLSNIYERNYSWLSIWGRLKPGITLAQAQASVSALDNRLVEFNERRTLLEPAGKGYSLLNLRQQLAKPLTVLMVIALLILLAACANVANLLLAQANTQRKENAIRVALGATRFKIFIQILSASLLLGLFGGIAGAILAPWLSKLLIAFYPRINSGNITVPLNFDARILWFALLVSILSGLISGLAAALRSSKLDLTPILKGDIVNSILDTRHLGLRHGLIVLQFAFAVVVLIIGTLFTKSLWQIYAIDPGFDAKNVLLLGIDLQSVNNLTIERQLYSQLSAQIKSVPGVEAVSASQVVPMGGIIYKEPILPEGYEAKPDELLPQDVSYIGPGFHQLMNTKIAAGRDFTETDSADSPGVAIVNEAFAQRYFKGDNPIGKRLKLGKAGDKFLEIVGLARSMKYHDLREQDIPHYDRPLLQRSGSIRFFTMFIRTSMQEVNVLTTIQREIKSIDPKIKIAEINTLTQKINNSIATERMAMLLANIFATLAFLIAISGIYTLMAYSVSRRTRELGIRMALGAQGHEILLLIVREGVYVILAGLVIGLTVAFATMKFISSLLFGVKSADMESFVIVSLLVVSVAILACYLPARRATKVDPIATLRRE